MSVKAHTYLRIKGRGKTKEITYKEKLTQTHVIRDSTREGTVARGQLERPRNLEVTESALHIISGRRRSSLASADPHGGRSEA